MTNIPKNASGGTSGSVADSEQLNPETEATVAGGTQGQDGKYLDKDSKGKPEYISARATRMTAWLTFILVIVTAVYAFISYRALNVTDGQLTVMQQQIDGQRRQIRPYIDVGVPTAFNRPDPTNQNQTDAFTTYPSADITITTVGGTPALSVFISYGYAPISLAKSKPVRPRAGPDAIMNPPKEGVPPYFYQGNIVTGADGDPARATEPMPDKVTYRNVIAEIPRLFKGESRTVTLEDRQQNWFNLIERDFLEADHNLVPELIGEVRYSDGYGYIYHTPFCFVFLRKLGTYKCREGYGPT